MKALGVWLVVVRLAVVAVFALQLSSSAVSAPRLKDGVSHAAVGVKASCVSARDHESHQTNRFDSSAHSGQIETSKFAARSSRTQDIGALALMQCDTSAAPPARACGARARDIKTIMRARARAVGRPVVRLAGGFDFGAAAPKVTSVERHLGLVRLGSSTRRTAASSIKALTRRGAAKQKPQLTRRYSRTSDRNSCPLCTLIRARSGSVGISRSRDFVGGRETDFTRGVTQLETCHGSEFANVIDAGSSPVASPTSQTLGSPVEDNPDPAAYACIVGWLRPTTRKGGPSATSQSHSAHRQATAARTKRSDLSVHRNQSVRSAQQQESATRLASVALSVTGSAAARPGSIAWFTMGERLELRPLSITGARKQVKLLHRHLPKVVGGLFASSVYVGDELAGVAMASEPKAPALRNRRIVEITRCATDGSKNACSKLYGALCRAAGNIGYTQARTYTRLDEPGTSLRAAGFVDDGLTREESWDRPSRKRAGELSQVRRWVRTLGGAA